MNFIILQDVLYVFSVGDHQSEARQDASFQTCMAHIRCELCVLALSICFCPTSYKEKWQVCNVKDTTTVANQFAHTRSQSFSKDLICNYTGATTTAALYFPAVPLSLLLIRSAIHVACYTLNAEKKTKNPFICFYIRFSVFATLIGFLTLVASTTLAIQR